MVKAPDNAKATNWQKRGWSAEVSGRDLVGMLFGFSKADCAVPNGPSKGKVAILNFQDEFGESDNKIPAGSGLHVLIDCVCKFEDSLANS